MMELKGLRSDRGMSVRIGPLVLDKCPKLPVELVSQSDSRVEQLASGLSLREVAPLLHVQ